MFVFDAEKRFLYIRTDSLKMEGASFFETSVIICKTALHPIPRH